MKNKLIIANWKMNLDNQKTVDLTADLLKRWQEENVSNLEIVVCPSFIALKSVAQQLVKHQLKLGAQDCFWEASGAYTGEISPLELKNIGCDYVIVGHSERRTYCREDDQIVNQKVRAALRHNLAPIICIGETFEERQAGNKDFVIMQQVEKAVQEVKLNLEQRLVIAYEPVWVIGSGQAVSPDEAEHTNQVIRQVLLDAFPLSVIEERIYLIYGGSVNPENIKSFMSQKTIEGALVGTASLSGETFWQLIKSV